MPTPHRICRVSELSPGERRIVELAGKSIGVFNVHGSFHAVRNVCPHQFAPLCAGKITGYAPPSPVGEYNWSSPGAIIRCPWHGWEFDIATGRSVFNPHRVRTQSLPVTIESDASCSDVAERRSRFDSASCDHVTDSDATLEIFPTETNPDGWIVVHA